MLKQRAASGGTPLSSQGDRLSDLLDMGHAERKPKSVDCALKKLEMRKRVSPVPALVGVRRLLWSRASTILPNTAAMTAPLSFSCISLRPVPAWA